MTRLGYKIINPLASPSAGAPALKYGDVNTVTPSPGEAKGLITFHFEISGNDVNNKQSENVLFISVIF